MRQSRIPDFANLARTGMVGWFDEMALRGLLFHPEDAPASIIRIATGEPLFTASEGRKFDGILAAMFDKFGDGVCEAAYPVFMQAAGLPLARAA